MTDPNVIEAVRKLAQAVKAATKFHPEPGLAYWDAAEVEAEMIRLRAAEKPAEAAPVATPVANVVGERERWLALADKWQADPSLDGNAAFEAGVMAVIGRVRAAAKATPAAKPVDTEDALRRERTEALDTLAEINNIAAHALDIATIHNPGPGFVKAHVERLAKEHRALRTAKPVVPVKFDASHAARGDGWHARAYNDGYISIGIQLRPGEDAGETVAKMLAACGRGL